MLKWQLLCGGCFITLLKKWMPGPGALGGPAPSSPPLAMPFSRGEKATASAVGPQSLRPSARPSSRHPGPRTSCPTGQSLRPGPAHPLPFRPLQGRLCGWRVHTGPERWPEWPLVGSVAGARGHNRGPCALVGGWGGLSRLRVGGAGAPRPTPTPAILHRAGVRSTFGTWLHPFTPSRVARTKKTD